MPVVRWIDQNAEKALTSVLLGSPDGSALIRSGDAPIWLRCRTAPPEPSDSFAHGLPFEVFNSRDYPYAEAEWHSPSQILLPGAAMTFEQHFQIWLGDSLPPGLRLTEAETELLACMS